MPKSDAATLARARYDKMTRKLICINLLHTTDAELIERLEREENKQRFLKRLIREDIQRSKK